MPSLDTEPRTHTVNFRLRATLLAVVAPLTLLTACTSVPLPVWTPDRQAPAASVSGPSLPLPTPAPPAVVVQTSPVVPPAVTTTMPAEAPSPYSAAVDARFPAPATVYNTPGLLAGRTSFTSQEEIQKWLRDQAASLSRSVGIKAAVLPFGSSQQGQPLEALVITRGAGTDPAALEATGVPTVLMVGQQHGDEPAGSEALLIVARELSQGLLQPLLERINVVIVPRANPDGTSRGIHTTPGGLDIASDHLLLESPEAQALARLSRDYKPTVVIDAHEYQAIEPYLQKFGAVQKFDAQLQFSTTLNQPEFLTKADEEWFRRPLLAALKAQGLTTEWYHTTSASMADKKVTMGGPQANSMRNVEGLKNAISLLVETRGADLGRLHIQRRVHTQVTAMVSVLGSTAQRSKELSQLHPYIEKEISAQACKGQAVVNAATTPAQYELVMLDPATGTDKTLTVDWNSALALQPLASRVRPCGYWLSPASSTAVERLRLHGVEVRKVLEPSALLGDLYRETGSSGGARQVTAGTAGDNASAVKTSVVLTRGVIDAPPGSYYVPMNQPLANLAMAALEPDTATSFLANQLLNGLASTARVMAEPSMATEAVP